MPELEDLKPYAGVFFTTVFLFLMLYAVDIEASINALTAADPLFLLLAFVTVNIPLIAHVYVWRKVLSMVGITLGYFNTLRLILANIFVNNITPFGDIGGEAAATFIISSLTEKSYGESFTPVFTASMINFSPFFTFLIFGAIYTGFIQILVIPLLLVLIYVIIQRTDHSITVPESVQDFRRDFMESMDLIKSSSERIWPLFCLTHFALLFDILSIVLIGNALGLDLYSLSMFFVVPLARVANYLPSPGGTGPYELALSGLLVYFFPISISEGVLVAVIYRVMTYYIGIVFGYLAINSFQIGKSYLTE